MRIEFTLNGLEFVPSSFHILQTNLVLFHCCIDDFYFKLLCKSYGYFIFNAVLVLQIPSGKNSNIIIKMKC